MGSLGCPRVFRWRESGYWVAQSEPHQGNCLTHYSISPHWPSCARSLFGRFQCGAVSRMAALWYSQTTAPGRGLASYAKVNLRLQFRRFCGSETDGCRPTAVIGRRSLTGGSRLQAAFLKPCPCYSVAGCFMPQTPRSGPCGRRPNAFGRLRQTKAEAAASAATPTQRARRRLRSARCPPPKHLRVSEPVLRCRDRQDCRKGQARRGQERR